jgi:hypothetical protein
MSTLFVCIIAPRVQQNYPPERRKRRFFCPPNLEAISKIPVVVKGRALAHLSKKKKSKNPQNSPLFLWFFDSFIFKICTKFAALLTKGVFEMASRY